MTDDDFKAKGYHSKSEMKRVEVMKEGEPRCPRCESKHLTVERRPDGNAICGDCLWQGLYKDCFGKEKPLDYEEMARVVHLYLKEWCDESLSYPDMCADSVRRAKSAFASLLAKLSAAEKSLEQERAINAVFVGALAEAAEYANRDDVNGYAGEICADALSKAKEMRDEQV